MRDRIELKARILRPVVGGISRCVIPNCGRPTMRSAGVGLAEMHCKYHVAYRARHGSYWCPTYTAADLKPYLKSAAEYIKRNRAETFIAHTILGLQALLDGAGRAEPAQDIKHRSAAHRARVALARLREAHVAPERLLAIHMAVSALIEDDAGSHRVKEFRIVQVAKAVHRLASGTHKQWAWPLPDGRMYPIPFHAYPKSSGRVLRIIGDEIEELCAKVTERDLDAVRALKKEQFGPHPSQVSDSGWRPHWARRREEAKKQAGNRA
jgi:hypothetical protein